MKLKSENSIRKLINSVFKSYQSHMCFNALMLKIIFFGCRVVESHAKQKNESGKIKEENLIKKNTLNITINKVFIK